MTESTIVILSFICFIITFASLIGVIAFFGMTVDKIAKSVSKTRSFKDLKIILSKLGQYLKNRATNNPEVFLVISINLLYLACKFISYITKL